MVEQPYNFGCLPMPAGYSVVWHSCHEHFQAHGPDEWESSITCDPYQARRWCLWHADQVVKNTANVMRTALSACPRKRRHGGRD